MPRCPKGSRKNKNGDCVFYTKKNTSTKKHVIIEEEKIQNNSECISKIKINCEEWIEFVFKRELAYTKLGSIIYLFFGEKPSDQSINIKLGRFGEFLSQELIKQNNDFELLKCGVQNINNETKKTDIDLIFKNTTTKTIYYFELKGNIQLDTEKLPATLEKCKKIEKSLNNSNSDYTIVTGILNWSIYNRQKLTAGLSNIKTFENGGIQIYHMQDFLKILKINWIEDDFYSYFRELGDKIKKL